KNRSELKKTSVEIVVNQFFVYVISVLNANLSLLVNTVYIDMSTQNRSSGSSRNQKKSNSGSGGGGGGDSSVIHSHKKTDLIKTEKEKSHPTPTAEQLRIAQIIEANISEDPQMREKVFTLIEMTQRSEEEVCCALNECDNNLERAVVFLLETLPVGAFERSSKKKKNKAANAVQDNVGDGDWVDNNANTDKREKSRNRNNNNRNGRGGTDSRGWRGREARENERNSRGLDRDDRTNDNYRSNQRGGGRSGRGSGYVGRRGGGRVGAGRGAGGRADRNEYGSRYNANDDHQEVELWDNTIAQNAEKLQQQTQDDAWGDWDNEEYVGSLKNSKVFTTSNLPNQTAASVLSGTVNSSGSANSAAELTAPPGLEHHLGTSVIGGGTTTGQSQGSHLNALVGNAVGAGSSLVDDSSSGMTSANVLPSATTTPLMQYSAAVSSTPQLQQQQQSIVGGGSSSLMTSSNTQYGTATATQFGATVDSFTNAANAAANLVQQVQQQQQQQQQLTPQLKTSATLSAEQSQYFNSLTSQSAAANAVAAVANVQQQQQQVQQMSNYGQNPASVQYQTSYANVFGSAATGNAAGTDLAAQLGSNQQPQVRRARAKLPPPSKIPSTAVEMPGDSLNNIGYLDVQFGALDFGTEDTFENIPDKFNTSVTIEAQQQQQQTQQQSQKGMVQTPQDVVTSYDSQTKAGVLAQQQQQVTQQQQQVSLSTGLQGSHLDSLSAGYTQRPTQQQQQQQQVQQQVSGVGSSGTVTGNVALDQLTKNDPYSQTNSNAVVASSYQSAYQGSANVANKAAVNVYQPSVATQGYNNSNYGNVQSSVANTYQPQTYASYQQNSVNSYQQHQQQQQVTANTQGAANVAASGSVGGGSTTQNIPSVGGSGSNNTTANANTSYLSSAYGSQQNAYQAGQSVYGNAGLSNNTGYSGNTNTSSTQYSNFSASAKLKETSASSNPSHYESVSSGSAVSNSGSAVNAVTSAVNSGNAPPNKATLGSSLPLNNIVTWNVVNCKILCTLQQGYYDLNYTPTSLGAGRDNLGSVAYSAMTDGRFARTDNNSSPVSNVSSTMSQQAGSSGPMLNVPYAYFYGGNVMPGSFQYGTPAIYPQIPAANTASGGQFPKPSYNTGYGSTNYDALSQASQDYTKGTYPSSVNQQTKSQNVTNPPQAGTASDITSSMYGKGHVALNKVNSYEKQNFHSGTPPPFNMPNTQAAGGTSAQPYGMYLPTMPAAGHHMIHPPIHQVKS
uniref:Protein lingerer n=1 Tax=Glossina austeni TaxID=7395 RepID=A0A1A9VM84_GLOAU